jgi:hypothetical protein
LGSVVFSSVIATSAKRSPSVGLAPLLAAARNFSGLLVTSAKISANSLQVSTRFITVVLSTMTMKQGAKEVSVITRENSRKLQERSTMYSSAADVAEMQAMCVEIADKTASSAHPKDRISAVATAIGVGWNRALEFLAGKARRIDGWEKDLARENLAELKRAEEQRRIAGHVAYLNRTLSYLKASDPELYGPHIDLVERGLAAGGVLDCAVAETAAEPARAFGMRLPSPNDDDASD